VTRLSPPPPPAARPLRRLDALALRARFRDALEAADGADGAHTIHESWMRGTPAAEIEAALGQLWQRARTIPAWLPMHYVPWLCVAYEVASRFNATRRGRHNIYLVSLDFTDRRAGLSGVYVGMTAHAPDLRFDQHRAGIRAARSVMKRGGELLLGPVLHLQRIARADAIRIEHGLASALDAAGLVVEGGH
jgi:hypothetical protein